MKISFLESAETDKLSSAHFKKKNLNVGYICGNKLLNEIFILMVPEGKMFKLSFDLSSQTSAQQMICHCPRH